MMDRSSLLSSTRVPAHVRRPPPRSRYPRLGWRRALRLAVERRMLGPAHLIAYARQAIVRGRSMLAGQRIAFLGVAFLGRRVELEARAGHGRVVVGPWCWIGDGTAVRAHEGQVTIGEKVVLGRDVVVDAYLDIEIGAATIIADRVTVVDFDHRFARLDVPIKDQGIVAAPTRIGPDVWIGEKATILRGVDVGVGAVIGSHAVVDADVPPFAVAVGVPARVIRSRLADGVDPEAAAARLRAGLPVAGGPDTT